MAERARTDPERKENPIGGHTQRGNQFLGFSVSWRKSRRQGWGYAHVEPHSKSQQKLRDSVKELLNHWTMMRPEDETIRALNRKLRGWKAYFRYGNPSHVFCKMEYYLQNKTAAVACGDVMANPQANTNDTPTTSYVRDGACTRWRGVGTTMPKANR